jgi:ABC-type branched-subunit amino acid transport system substrate-binding protein
MTRFPRWNQWLSLSYVKAFALSASFAALSACTTAPQPRPLPQQGPIAQLPTQAPAEIEPVETQAPEETVSAPAEVEAISTAPRSGLTPPHMDGRNIRRLAVILPFSSRNSQLRAESDSLLKAAQIAIFNQDNADSLLIPFDTKGTTDGTRAAVENAVKAGADVIIGPILSASVREARKNAARANIPVIGFSTDQRAAGSGAYLLSFPPEAEINRIVAHARESGISRFAFLGPDNAYGRRVRQAYSRAVAQSGGEITAVETYESRDISAMQGPAQKLAAAFAQTEETRAETDPLAFEAIILPESGIALRTLAPLLTFYEDDLRKVQLLGTGQWQDDDTAREPALNGGIFAGPDIEERQRFRTGYDRIYGSEPGRLASLAYDAVNIAQFVASGDPKTRYQRLQDPAGFYGVDGLVRFRANGTPERGLAVYEIQNGRIRVIEAAPRQTNGPS